MIKVSQVFAWLIMAMGILALVGWLFNLDLLRNFVPGAVFMNPTTAVCFVLIVLLCLFQSLLFDQ